MVSSRSRIGRGSGSRSTRTSCAATRASEQNRRASMKVKAANGFARILKTEGIPRVSRYPTNHVTNALGEEGVPILMMGEERFGVAVADAFSRVTAGKQFGVCTVMVHLNSTGITIG